MYYHFSSKQELAYAELEEWMQKRTTQLWIGPLQKYTDPLEGIHTVFQELEKEWSNEFFDLGCQLNLKTSVDDGFRERIQKFFKIWQKALVEVLKNGQK